jgi:anti-sigma factor RsiW
MTISDKAKAIAYARFQCSIDEIMRQYVNGEIDDDESLRMERAAKERLRYEIAREESLCK